MSRLVFCAFVGVLAGGWIALAAVLAVVALVVWAVWFSSLLTVREVRVAERGALVRIDRA